MTAIKGNASLAFVYMIATTIGPTVMHRIGEATLRPAF